jgi:hypothetical protein
MQVSQAMGSFSSSKTAASVTASVDKSLQRAKPVQKKAVTAAVRAEVSDRCVGTVGDWCQGYLLQEEVPAVTAPRGNKTCSMDCNKASPDHQSLLAALLP